MRGNKERKLLFFYFYLFNSEICWKEKKVIIFVTFEPIPKDNINGKFNPAQYE